MSNPEGHLRNLASSATCVGWSNFGEFEILFRSSGVISPRTPLRLARFVKSRNLVHLVQFDSLRRLSQSVAQNCDERGAYKLNHSSFDNGSFFGSSTIRMSFSDFLAAGRFRVGRH